jgi:anti-sigma B factor antagonist
MAAPFDIVETREGSVTVLALKGRLVADEADFHFIEYVNALVADGRVRIVLDLREVIGIDSGGVGTLVAKLLSTRRVGGDLRLAALSDRTRRVLEITRLLTVFYVFETADAAVRSYTVEVPRLPAGVAGA